MSKSILLLIYIVSVSCNSTPNHKTDLSITDLKFDSAFKYAEKLTDRDIITIVRSEALSWYVRNAVLSEIIRRKLFNTTDILDLLETLDDQKVIAFLGGYLKTFNFTATEKKRLLTIFEEKSQAMPYEYFTSWCNKLNSDFNLNVSEIIDIKIKSLQSREDSLIKLQAKFVKTTN
jgi:hypothetical protein